MSLLPTVNRMVEAKDYFNNTSYGKIRKNDTVLITEFSSEETLGSLDSFLKKC